MRTVVILAIILLIMFAGNSFYSRSVAQHKLNDAVSLIPADPLGSYRTIKEVLDYNRMVALGKIGDVEAEYLKELERKVVVALSATKPDPEIYPETDAAIAALGQFSQQTGIKVKEARVRIVKAARDSVTALKDKGRLRAWDNMIAMFQSLSGDPDLMGLVFEGNFQKWFDEIKAVPRRPFGVRDALNDAVRDASIALDDIKLHAAETGEPPVATAPAELTDNQLIAAEKHFGQGQGEIINFQNQFAETDKTPAELCGIQAKLAYDKAAIKLAHFQDRKETINKTGSDYLTEFLIRSDTSEVPSASEMVSSWSQNARSGFQESRAIFLKTTGMDESMQKAYCALSLWSEGTLNSVFAPNANEPLHAQALQGTETLSAPAAKVIKTMQENPRVLLITELP